jgi:hypothetical protein
MRYAGATMLLFRVVTPCRLTGRYKRFGDSWRRRGYASPKCWLSTYESTRRHKPKQQRRHLSCCENLRSPCRGVSIFLRRVEKRPAAYPAYELRTGNCFTQCKHNRRVKLTTHLLLPRLGNESRCEHVIQGCLITPLEILTLKMHHFQQQVIYSGVGSWYGGEVPLILYLGTREM